MGSTLTDEAAWRDSQNPVLAGFRPDPSVCRVDVADGTSWYYCVNSTFEYLPGLSVHRSRNLVTWEFVGHVVTDQLDYRDAHDSGGLYAPTIRHDGDRFVVVCTHLHGGTAPKGNFVVTAVEAAGPWSAPVWWDDTEGIDPSLLIDDDGRWWAHGARAASAPRWPDEGEVWVREVDPSTLQLIGDEAVVWYVAAVGAAWTEGPHLYRRGRYVYLVAAEGGTGQHHAVVVARAESPQGVFEPHPDNPVLTHRHLGQSAVVANVGHADLVDGADGSSWALALATRLVGGYDLLGRETFLVPVEWEDDWPVFAPGVGTLVPEPVPSDGPDAVVGRAAEPENPWVAVRRLPGEVASELTPDTAVFVAPGIDADLSSPLPAFVGRALRHTSSRLRSRVPEPLPGDAVGVALRQSGGSWIAASRFHDRVEVTQCVGDEPTTHVFAVAGGAGEFVIDASGSRSVVRWIADGVDEHVLGDFDIAHLSTVGGGGFVGVVGGVFALGDGTYALGPVWHERWIDGDRPSPRSTPTLAATGSAQDSTH